MQGMQLALLARGSGARQWVGYCAMDFVFANNNVAAKDATIVELIESNSKKAAVDSVDSVVFAMDVGGLRHRLRRLW